MYIIYLVLGLVLLYYGANFLVKGSSSIAMTFGVRKIVVGLTVVALGTSMPEFVVSLFGVISKADNVSVGNIVGSNLANILLVLGVTSLIKPLKSEKSLFKLDFPVLLVITLLFLLFCSDSTLSGIESGIMLLLFIVYMLYLLINSKERGAGSADLNNVEKGHITRNVLLSVAGLVGLVLGGSWTVKGGVQLAQILGISNLVIGLTVIALGTSLPELFTSVVAVIKNEQEISIGNIVGSNLFNIAFVLGIVPMIRPLQIDPHVIKFDNYFMMGITVLLLGFLYFGKRLSRIEGGIFLILYLFFILNLRYHFI